MTNTNNNTDADIKFSSFKNGHCTVTMNGTLTTFLIYKGKCGSSTTHYTVAINSGYFTKETHTDVMISDFYHLEGQAWRHALKAAKAMVIEMLTAAPEADIFIHNGRRFTLVDGALVLLSAIAGHRVITDDLMTSDNTSLFLRESCQAAREHFGIDLRASIAAVSAEVEADRAAPLGKMLPWPAAPAAPAVKLSAPMVTALKAINETTFTVGVSTFVGNSCVFIKDNERVTVDAVAVVTAKALVKRGLVRVTNHKLAPVDAVLHGSELTITDAGVAWLAANVEPDAQPEAPANVVTFGKGERVEPDHADSGICFDVFVDGKASGEIVSYKDNVGTILTKEFKTVSYTLSLWVGRRFDVEDVTVEVSDFTSARQALSAIKQIARDRLAVMHGDDDAAKLKLIAHGEQLAVAFPDAHGISVPTARNVTGQHLFCMDCACCLGEGEGEHADSTVLRDGFVCCNCGTRTDNQTDADAEAELQQARDEWSAINGEVSDFRFRLVMRAAAHQVLHVSEPLINSWRRACAAKHAVAMAKAGQTDNKPDGSDSTVMVDGVQHAVDHKTTSAKTFGQRINEAGAAFCEAFDAMPADHPIKAAAANRKPFKMSDREIKTQTAEESVTADPFWKSSADALDVPADAPDVEPAGITVSNVKPSQVEGCSADHVDADVAFNGRHVCSVTLAPDAVTDQLSISLNGLEWHVDNIDALQMIADGQATDTHWAAVESRLSDKYGADGFDVEDIQRELSEDHQPYYFNKLLDDIVEAVTTKLAWHKKAAGMLAAKERNTTLKTWSEACADVQGQLVGSLDADDIRPTKPAEPFWTPAHEARLRQLEAEPDVSREWCNLMTLKSEAFKAAVKPEIAPAMAVTHDSTVVQMIASNNRLAAELALLDTINEEVQTVADLTSDVTSFTIAQRDEYLTHLTAHASKRSEAHLAAVICLVLDADKAVLMPPSKLLRLLHACLPGWSCRMKGCLTIQPAKLDGGDRSFVLTVVGSTPDINNGVFSTVGNWQAVATDNTVHRFKVIFNGSADIAADIAAAWHATAEAAQDKADEAQGAADFDKTGKLPDNWSDKSDAYQEGWRAAEDQAADFKDWQDNVVGPSEEQRASEAMSDKIAMYQNEY